MPRVFLENFMERHKVRGPEDPAQEAVRPRRTLISLFHGSVWPRSRALGLGASLRRYLSNN